MPALSRLAGRARWLPLPIGLCLSAASPPPAPLPVHVGGRVIPEPSGAASFGWPGIYFESRFRGPGVRVAFDAPAEHMRLLIDGREKAVFRAAGRVALRFSSLGPGDHVVRLEKLTESQTGGGRFLGFFPADGSAPLPVRKRERQIEFIGDSYTVGYGNTSASRECSQDEVHDRTDTQQAFGPLVARRFDADYRVNAYSGFGVVRNYGGGRPELSLPRIYGRLKPDVAARLEGGSSDWRPQIIVVNLGTNDYSTPLKPGERWRDRAELDADYRATYAAFLRSLHARQPQARFVLMASDDFLPQVEQVAAALARELPGRVSTLKFAGLDRLGCHYHPSLADDRLLADLVADEIGRHVKGWKATP